MIDRSDIDTEKIAWETKFEELRDLGRQIWDLALQLEARGVLPEAGGTAIFIKEVTEELQEKLLDVDLHKYAAFHALTGSGVEFQDCPDLDVEGSEIEKIMREKLEYLQNLSQSKKEINE